MRSALRNGTGAWLLCLASTGAPAQSADELAALQLADQAPEKPAEPQASGWQGHGEVAWGQARAAQAPVGEQTLQRQSLKLQGEGKLDSLRWTLAMRLDHSQPAQAPYPATLLSLQEAFLTWQAAPGLLFDFGRVNARQGLGTGYNPSDFLRAGALRSRISADPASLKSNRLGTVMLRAQRLWDDGALTAVLAPRLERNPSQAGLSADLGATNRRHQAQLIWSQRWSEDLQPQWLLHMAEGQAAQLGFNLSSLLGQAGLAYVEWAGGRAPDQLVQASKAGDGARRWQQRLATGLRYTTHNKLSATLEWAYNSAALNRADWQALQATPQAYARYRQWTAEAQELNTRGHWAVYLNWPDLPGLPQLDLNALWRFNPEDHSHMSWLELRRRWPGVDLALQWQQHRGQPGSDYGALPQSRTWQLSLRGYF